MPYAHAMYRSLHEVVLAHDDHVAVHPTHGAGSLCATGIASTPTSTIGYEKRHNQLLHAADVEAFVRASAPRPAGRPALLRPDAADEPGRARASSVGVSRSRGRSASRRRGARSRPAPCSSTSDARPSMRSSHAPGSQSIPLGPSFGTWLGWVVDPERPLVLVLERAADWDEAIRQALRIGAEGAIVGHLRGGFGTWADGGGPLESSGRLNVDELAERLARGGAEAPARDRRPAGERIRDGPRPGQHPDHGGLAPGPACRAARAIARSRPSAPRASGRASRPRSSGRTASRTSRGSRAACRPGRPPGIRWSAASDPNRKPAPPAPAAPRPTASATAT